MFDDEITAKMKSLNTVWYFRQGSFEDLKLKDVEVEKFLRLIFGYGR
jgi:hypothetical protein